MRRIAYPHEQKESLIVLTPKENPSINEPERRRDSLFYRCALRLPRPIPTFIVWLAFLLGAMFAGRLAFWLAFNASQDPLSALELAKAFYVGSKFDLQIALLIVLPLLVLGGTRFCLKDNGLARVIWRAYFMASALLLVCFYVIDFGYYAYLQVRLDSSSLRFLENFAISIKMVFESYPVIWVGVGGLVFGYALFLGSGWIVSLDLGCASKDLGRKQRRIAKAGVWCFVLLGLYGSLSSYPLRWSNAFWSSNAFVSSLSSNPLLYFAATFKNRELVFDEELASYFLKTRIGDYLGLDRESSRSLDFRRESRPPHSETPMNVVVVIVESLAGYRTGLSGNPLNPSPVLDNLAREGVYFPRFYTPHMGTARGVWATITGIPDVEMLKSSSRNPLVIDQRTIISDFKGYEKFYFLGGSMNWANIRGLIVNNISGIQIYEEGSYDSKRVDVWGISDLSLFKEANTVLSQSDKPFFAIVQTSGNHRPFTIPSDNEGFNTVEYDKKSLQLAGFESNAELNAFRLSDHSIGHFMTLAREQSYFDNTLFVFLGDHGVPGYAGEHSPAYENTLDLVRHRVPLVFYAPKHLEPRVMDQVASMVDVMPSVAGLANIPYVNTTLGRDLFDPQFDEQRFAYTIFHERGEMGLIEDSHYLVMKFDGSDKRFYELDNSSAQTVAQNSRHDQAQDMILLCRGIYETANYLRYHNRKGDAH